MSGQKDSELAEFLHGLADGADQAVLPYFRRANAVTNKLDEGYDPVTEADRRAEQVMRALIEARYPEHGIFGEEFGHKTPGTSGSPTWVLDPIDGTRAFITGMLNWMTLIGLTDERGAYAGMASQAFTKERFFVDGETEGAWYRGPAGELEKLEVSNVTKLEDAKFCSTVPEHFTGPLEPFLRALLEITPVKRFSGDAYFYCMLAAGQVDVIVEPQLQAYDIAALIPIIEKAGGVVTTLEGTSAHGGGDVVAAATPQLHEAVLNLLENCS